jgi:Ca-activated chloride channel family protein
VKVASYRLIGYENRMLKKEDFADDKKDAGEIGAGHTVTALYEIVPVYYDEEFDAADAEAAAEAVAERFKPDDLKYVETKLSDKAFGDEIVTVHVRYKEPDGETSKLITTVIDGEPVELEEASKDLRFASAVAMYAMILRKSEHMGGVTLEEVKKLAKKSRGDDENGYRAEFIRQVELTELVIGLASK